MLVRGRTSLERLAFCTTPRCGYDEHLSCSAEEVGHAFTDLHRTLYHIPYSGKLSREKTFADWRKIRFSRRKLMWIARFCCAKGYHVPQISWRKLLRIATKPSNSFSLKSFRYTVLLVKHCKINVETTAFCTYPVMRTRSCRSAILGSWIVEMGPYCRPSHLLGHTSQYNQQ